MRQTWNDLLFAHWPVSEAQVRPRVPAAFELDLFDGDAWIGIVPFHMTNVTARGVPPLPWLSAFPELNVRTYVRVGSKPGVYFFSLDAGRMLAVLAARLLNLPYFAASMQVARAGEAVRYRSRRPGWRAEFEARYQPIGPVYNAVEGSLDYFLTERYCLYELDRMRRPYRLDIDHAPWPLQPASADITKNTMAGAAGITLPSREPLLHFARRQDMVGWTMEFIN
jgi:uncharacterized protein YqjF (DUF2071 family)